MNIARKLHMKSTVSMTHLRQNPRKVIQIAENGSVAVLDHNKPKFYVLSAKTYEALVDFIDDTLLIHTINARRGGKTIKVKI